MPTFNQARLGARNQSSLEREYGLNETAGDPVCFGIAYSGDFDQDSLLGREEEGEEERRDEPCHLANLLLLLDFMFGVWASIIDPPVYICPVRSVSTEIDLEISLLCHWLPNKNKH